MQQQFTSEQIAKLEEYLGVKEALGEYEKKLWNKVQKYKKYLEYIPGIACVCVCNSLAMNACHKDSDIDLFIITKRNRLWTARIYTTLLFVLLGQRKTASEHAGKFCLSFFISEDNLSFDDIFIKNDIYLWYWLRTLKPIVNKNNTFEKFLAANYSPQSGILSPLEEKGATSNLHLHFSPKGENCMRELCEQKIERGVVGDLQEYILKKIFLPRTKKSFQKLGKPFGVIISDTMLKFHDKDRRYEIRDRVV